MSRTYFGTDGIRGTVGQGAITPDFMLKLGHAVGRVLRRSTDKATVLIGKDTRISGYMLESALEAGFASAGVDVLLSGPLPTPGVAYLTRALRHDLGVVISASHNAFADNTSSSSARAVRSCPTNGRSPSKPRSSSSRSGATRRLSARPSGWPMPVAATSSFARAPCRTRCRCAA